MGKPQPVLGVIEGFYGEPWSWEERHASLGFLADRGFSEYLYAPKGEGSLRRKWREPPPPGQAQSWADFREACRGNAIGFGVGLTPLGLHETWDHQGRVDLARRLGLLADLKLDSLAILFDDMPGNFPELARTQAEILSFVADCGVGARLIMCPTYYSDAEVLDKVFGRRPPGYLEELGKALDPEVEVFWTGPEVCSKTYPADHLAQVTARLGRRPVVWDNYPVNDGPRMCRRLHLGAPDRPGALREAVAGIFLNPMNQSYLSRAVLDAAGNSLASDGPQASGPAATSAALHRVFPTALAALLYRDYRLFGEQGLDGIAPEASRALIGEYRALDHPAAREVVHWLEGKSVVSAEVLTDS